MNRTVLIEFSSIQEEKMIIQQYLKYSLKTIPSSI
jgi:hypothetical protein